MGTSASAAARYWDLKIAQCCTCCGAGLPEEAETTLCVECRERSNLHKAIVVRTPKGLAAAAKRAAKHRAKRIAEGRCEVEGCPNPPRPNRRTCEACKNARTAAMAKYRERKRLGLVETPDERRARQQRERAELLERKRALMGRIPTPRPLAEPRVRILRALLRLEWIRTRDLWIALEIEELDELGLERWTQALAREVRAGTVEARGPRMKREYNLSAAGRAFALELAEVA